MEFKAPQHELTQDVIRCAIEVHRVIGPGLKEEVYEAALAWGLRRAGHEVRRQVEVPVTYKGVKLQTHRENKKLDMLVEEDGVTPEEANRMQLAGDLGFKEGSGETSPDRI